MKWREVSTGQNAVVSGISNTDQILRRTHWL
jgi:hypothetical protein